MTGSTREPYDAGTGVLINRESPHGGTPLSSVLRSSQLLPFHLIPPHLQRAWYTVAISLLPWLYIKAIDIILSLLDRADLPLH